MMEFPYTRISGIRNFIPPYFSVVQISSRYIPYSKAQINCILNPSTHNHLLQKVFLENKVYSKIDSEWIGLLRGLEYALENGEVAIAIEHSNMELMQGLLIPGTRFHRESIYHYKRRLLDMTEQIEWLGGRVIPAIQNRAINPQLY